MRPFAMAFLMLLLRSPSSTHAFGNQILRRSVRHNNNPRSMAVRRRMTTPDDPSYEPAARGLLQAGLNRAVQRLREKEEAASGGASSSSSSSSESFRSVATNFVEAVVEQAAAKSANPETKNTDVVNAAMVDAVVDTDNNSNDDQSNKNDTKENNNINNNNTTSSDNSPTAPQPLRYSQNPLITSTALAHLLWGFVLRPGVDSAIDATCGNGHDAQQLIELLSSTTTTTTKANTASRLLCLDVQASACAATREATRADGGGVRTLVRQASHVHLRHEWERFAAAESNHDDDNNHDLPVGLVVFNLGYLPSSGDKIVQTSAETTLVALTQAAALIRVGGLVSVVTYPGSNPTEHGLVRTFWDGVARLHKRTAADNDEKDWDDRLRAAFDQLVQENGPKQSWRVHEVQKLGRDGSPVLFTAMRIK